MFAKLIIVLVLAALAVGMIARTSLGATPDPTYFVKPSHTLFSIAVASWPGDTREGVWKLQQRNHLRSATLRPGQTLVLPG